MKRISQILLILSFALLLGSLTLFWWIEQDAPLTMPQHISRFKRTHSPEKAIDYSFFLHFFAGEKLSRVRYGLPQSFSYPYEQIKALRKYQRTCRDSDLKNITFKGLIKAKLWQQLECGNLKALSQDFFSKAPFLHPFGKSFALLAYQSGRLPGVKWKYNYSHFHLMELGRVELSSPMIEKGFGLLASLELQDLQNLEEGRKLFLTQNYLFIYQPARVSGDLKYLSFERLKWENYLEHQGLELIPLSSKINHCLSTYSGYCLKRSKHWEQIDRAISWGLSGFALLSLVLGLFGIFLHKKKLKKELEQQRKFYLQVLTHELRTPLTSLQLGLEPLRDEFDQLPKRSQLAFMAISSEVSKLQRIAHSSKQYLQSFEDTKKMAFEKKYISSIHDYFENLLSRFDQKDVQLNLKGSDFAGKFDPYWVGMIVGNLIENAQEHGRPPVQVVVEQRGGQLQVAVIDYGINNATELSQLTAPFKKGNLSKGLGLGLNIVQKIIQEMRGELKYKKGPTTFEIRLECGV